MFFHVVVVVIAITKLVAVMSAPVPSVCIILLFKVVVLYRTWFIAALHGDHAHLNGVVC